MYICTLHQLLRPPTLLKELTKLEEFESIEPEECIRTRRFVNGEEDGSLDSD